MGTHGVDRNSASSGTGSPTVTPYMVEALRTIDDATDAQDYFDITGAANDAAIAMAIALG